MNNKTLTISNNTFEKLGCYALTSKAYLSKDSESRLYVKANHLLIENINRCFQVQNGSSKHNSDIYQDSIVDIITQNNDIKVYAPLSIKSILGKILLVTLWDGNSWNELICKTVEIVDYPKPNVKVCLYPDYDYEHSLDGVNKLTLNKLHLASELVVIPHEYDWKPYRVSYQQFVHFPIDILYSVEVKGEIEKREIDLPTKQFSHEGERSWNLNDISLTQIKLTVDFDFRRIYGEYLKEELFGGRRNSNGWINRYLVKRALYWKKFELIFDIQKFIDDLPELIKIINGSIQIYNNYKNTEKTIEIIFKEDLNFEQINKVLQFNVNGSTYTYYESDY